MERAGLRLLPKLRWLPSQDCSLGPRFQRTEGIRQEILGADLGDQRPLSTLNRRACCKVLGCPSGMNLWRNFCSDTEIQTPLSLGQSLISSNIHCQGRRGDTVEPRAVAPSQAAFWEPADLPHLGACWTCTFSGLPVETLWGRGQCGQEPFQVSFAISPQERNRAYPGPAHPEDGVSIVGPQVPLSF